MLEDKSYLKIKPGTDRNFGLVFAAVFAIIGLYPLLYDKNIHLWALITAFIFLFLSILLPKALNIPNKLWFKFGMLLGGIVAPIIITLLYFLTVTPTGIIMRLLGKDLLRQQFNSSVKSYWIERKKSLDTMKNQF